MNFAPHSKKVQLRSRRGFTLIEIMIVVAIIGLIAGSFVPILFSGRKEALRKAAADISDVCGSARAQAIMLGTMVEMHINPQERRISTGGKSESWSDKLALEMLDVNLSEYKEAEDARVRFYPNGTSDEMTIILLNPDNNERRKISLEPMTALANVESKVQ